jgi:hypothetical protein
MITNKSIPFIVEAGLNTSYIDSLFVSMFYKPSYIQDILIDTEKVNDVDTENENDILDRIYLQDIIYHYFVRNMRNKYTISFQTINELRNQLVYLGWKENENIVDLFEIHELYDFLIKKIYKNSLISFELENNKINNLINTWINDNLGKYKLKDIPKFISIYFDRKKNNNNYLVDIKEGINFEKNNIDDDQKEYLWRIHSIICFSNPGHYYSIVFDGSEWFLFSNKKLPALIKINIKDEDIVMKIKQECIFVMYTLDKKK